MNEGVGAGETASRSRLALLDTRVGDALAPTAGDCVTSTFDSDSARGAA
jgi:hypothetical protein